MEERIRGLFAKTALCEQIVSWERMERGYSNICFRVVTDKGNNYKVRFADNNYVIDRENERKILASVGVRPLYYGDNGDSVWRWIEGVDLTGMEVEEEMLGRLVNITEEMHSKSCVGILNHDDMEYAHLGVDYLTKDVVDLYGELVGKYASDPRCLCHNDISLSNLIYDHKSQTLNFIDYEWGRKNNPCWDYGNFVKESDLSEEKVIYLADKTNIPIRKLYEFAIMASCYSVQLSFVFRDQTVGLDDYRNRLKGQISKYMRWLSRR